jgi:hypothetical protein
MLALWSHHSISSPSKIVTIVLLDTIFLFKVVFEIILNALAIALVYGINETNTLSKSIIIHSIDLYSSISSQYLFRMINI